MSSEICEFYITNCDDPPQTLVGKVMLEDGKLKFWAAKGHENFIKTIREEQVIAKGRKWDPKKDPEGWFNALPHQYNGSMVRAQIVKTSGKMKEAPARKGRSRSGTKGFKAGKAK